MPEANVSALPSNLQEKRAKLLEQNKPAGVEEVKSVDKPVDKPAGSRVDISREEFNELQAAAARAKAAEGRAQSMAEDMEVLRHRLTELETASKGSGEGRAAPASRSAPSRIQFDPASEEMTDKEKEDFEQDTINLILKLARKVAKEEIAKVLPQIVDVLDSVENVAKTAVTTVGSVKSNTFNDKVREQVAEFSDFDTVVNHKHWQSFLQGEDEDNGESFADVLTRNLKNANLKGVVRVFRVFATRYLKDEQRTNGYAGGERSSGTPAEIPTGNKPEMLKISDRRKLHKRRINGEITQKEYEEEKAKYDLADKEGRLDYDN